MFRKFLVFVAASSFTLLLFMTVALTGIVLTFTPSNVKNWLRTSDVYSSIVEDVLKESQTLNKNSNKNKGQTETDSDIKNALDDPGIQAIAKQTFTPVFLQSTAEKIIDGTMPWLEGKVTKPSFVIDLAEVKTNFADNVGAYATTRYATLPTCPAGQVTDSTDILTITCKPAGFDPTPEIQKAVTDLKTNKDFISNTTLTADTLTVGENQSKEPLFNKLDKAPKTYRSIRNSPLIFGVLSLIAAATIVFLSSERRRGIRRVTVSLYVAGVLLAFEAYAATKAFDEAHKQLNKSLTDSNGLQNTGIAILKQIQHSLNSVTITFAASFLVVAAALTVYLVATKDKQPKDEPTKLDTGTLDKPSDDAKTEAEPADNVSNKHPKQGEDKDKASGPQDS